MRFHELLNENLGMPYPGTYEQEFVESNNDSHTATEIAKELHQNLLDLQEILSSESTIGAGNPHNVKSLRDDIVNLGNEIKQLGFQYDSKNPSLIRKLSNKTFK